jgi:L-malate glycosyltransferase
MKIVALADAANIHTQKWAYYFAGRGHQLDILSFRPAKLDTAQVHYVNAGVVRTEGGNWRYLLRLPTVRRLILQSKPDLIFCHYLTSYGLIGALLKSSLPLVVWLHGTDALVTPDRSPMYRWAMRYTLARCDLIIMAAAHMERRVQQMGGKDKRLMILPVGADLRKFNQATLVERKDLTCISNRQLVKNSNVDLLLAAIAHVRQMRPGIHLTIAGDGPLRSELESVGHRLDLASQVKFLGDVSNDAMPDLLRQHSLYLSATRSDGTSISLLEAMACGTFPIVSDIPANRAWITDGRNGFLIPLDQPDLLAQRILETVETPRLVSNARSINWELVKDRGDYLLNMGQAERAVEQLLRDRRSTVVQFSQGHEDFNSY